MLVTRAVKCEDVTEEIITESTAVEFWWFTVDRLGAVKYLKAVLLME